MITTPTPQFALELLSYLPHRPDYDTWIKVISAIGNTFDESTSLKILLNHFRDEKQNEHSQKLQNCLTNITFGTLFFFAKQYGYSKKTSVINRLYGSFARQADVKHVINKRIILDGDPELLFRFKDQELNHKMKCLIAENNLTFEEASKRILYENPNVEKERVYRIAVNRDVLNKNLNPVTRKPYERFDYKENCSKADYSILTNNFKNHYLTLKEIAKAIGKGYSICCSHLKENEYGRTRRSNDCFDCAELFAIDIDNTIDQMDSSGKRIKTVDPNYKTIDDVLNMPETQKALLLYTTPSHTEKLHRFRLVFALPRLLINKDHYRKIVEKYIGIYGGDRQCKDSVRAFYGNSNATINLVCEGTTMQFGEGCILW
jgi:hypothetical protein